MNFDSWCNNSTIFYEGPKRMRRAIAGLEELKRHLDTTIVVPNQNLFKIANEATGFEESFGYQMMF